MMSCSDDLQSLVVINNMYVIFFLGKLVESFINSGYVSANPFPGNQVALTKVVKNMSSGVPVPSLGQIFQNWNNEGN